MYLFPINVELWLRGIPYRLDDKLIPDSNSIDILKKI